MSDKISLNAISEKIRNLRKNSKEKLTQKKLAQKLGISQSALSNLESGKSTNLKHLIAIANYYNVSLDYLCNRDNFSDSFETLRSYINYDLSAETFYSGEKSHLIPRFKINEPLYKCLKQLALSKTTSDVPESVRKIWENMAIEEFNNTKEKNNSYISFIPLKEEIFNEHPGLKDNYDLLKVIDEHIEQ